MAMKEQIKHNDQAEETRGRGPDPLLMMTVALGFALVTMLGVMLFN